MTVTMFSSSLTCPNCLAPLIRTDRTLRCENNHCFDQAKQGYFNLLLSNKKKSKQPGDNFEMVQARNIFLNHGIYQPISDRLNQLCLEYLEQHNGTSQKKVLDIGCGEGYYTERLFKALKTTDNTHQLIGLDISKDAIKFAARRSKEINWLVASGASIPVENNSQDLITCLFTRLMPEGMAKAIHPQGRLFTVTTGKEHLIEMRNVLYQDVKDDVLEPAASLSSHFECKHQHQVQYQHSFNNRQILADLLAMTPHQWRAPESGRQALTALDHLDITIDVTISEFQRKDA